MLDGERCYASFPDENPAERPTQVSCVLLNAIKAFERLRQLESEQPLLKVETSCDADACESAKTSDEGVELRRVLGCWLKELREARGLSQRELAEKVGVEYYTNHIAIGIWLGSDTTETSYRLGKGSCRDAMGIRRQAHALLRPGNSSASLRQGVLQGGSAVALN